MCEARVMRSVLFYLYNMAWIILRFLLYLYFVIPHTLSPKKVIILFLDFLFFLATLFLVDE